MTKTDKDTAKLAVRLDEFLDAIDVGDTKLARFIVKKAVKKYPRHGLSFAMQGLAAVYIDNDHSEGYLYLKEAISKGYGAAFIYFNFGLCAEKSGFITESLEAFYESIERASPEELDAYGPARERLLLIQETLPEHVTLKQYFADAKEFEKGVSLLENQSFSDAISCFTKVTQSQPEHVQSHGNLGICHMYLGDHQLAKRAFYQALAIDPDYELAETNLQRLKALEKGEITSLPDIRVLDFYGDREKESANPAREVNQALSQAMSEEQFESLEEAQAFVDRFMQEHNDSPREDLLGLTPTQARELLTTPFEAPALLTRDFKRVSQLMAVPIYWLALNLLGALGPNGIKCTAAGNLPRDLCRTIFEKYQIEIDSGITVSTINKEEDFAHLHIARCVLSIAGLIRKHGGYWKPLNAAWKLYEQIQQGDHDAATELYATLFTTYITDFNLAYLAGDEENCAFYQSSIGFSLYILYQLGDTWRHSRDYQQLFEKTFPDEKSPVINIPGMELPSEYILRFWLDLAWQVGLIEKRQSSEGGALSKDIRATPLFAELITWHLPKVKLL